MWTYISIVWCSISILTLIAEPCLSWKSNGRSDIWDDNGSIAQAIFTPIVFCLFAPVIIFIAVITAYIPMARMPIRKGSDSQGCCYNLILIRQEAKRRKAEALNKNE